VAPVLVGSIPTGHPKFSVSSGVDWIHRPRRAHNAEIASSTLVTATKFGDVGKWFNPLALGAREREFESHHRHQSFRGVDGRSITGVGSRGTEFNSRHLYQSLFDVVNPIKENRLDHVRGCNGLGVKAAWTFIPSFSPVV
jgi:hypothetical protein